MRQRTEEFWGDPEALTWRDLGRASVHVKCDGWSVLWGMNLRRANPHLRDRNHTLELRKRLRRALFAGAAISCACTAARAQPATSAARQTLSISLGLFNENRRDGADSPLAYAGSGLAERIEFESVRAARRWYFTLDGGAATLVPTASNLRGHSEEAFGAYAINAGTDWRIHSSAQAGELALGVELAVALTVARHLYADQDLTEQTFDFGAVTLAPAVHWTRPAGTGALTASLAVPLLAWVDHPYADVRYANQFVDLHYASPAQLRQANGALSYAFSPRSRYGVTASYRVDVMQFAGSQPVRRFTQSLLVSLTRRFGPLP